jgi:hypothetical protein
MYEGHNRQQQRARGQALEIGAGDERLEAACCRAQRFEAPTYLTVKRILAQDLDQQEQSAPPPPTPARTFVRNASELLGHLFGGVAWN